MKKIIVFIIICFSSFQFLGADDISEDIKKVDLSIETAVSLALANNLDLEREKIKFNGYKWAALTSWNTFIPSVSMSATMARSNLTYDERTTTVSGLLPMNDVSSTVSDYVISYTADSVRNEWSLMANFNLSLNLSASMFFSIYQAGLDYKKGSISQETAEKRIIRDVKKTYYNLILLQEGIKILNQNLEAAKRRFDQAVVLYRSGQQNELAMLQAEINYENLLPEKIKSENDYQTYLLTFKHLIGLKNEAELVLTDTITIPELTDFKSDLLIYSFLDGKLEFKTMKNAINSLRNSRNLAISAMAPTFMIGFSMDPAFQHNPLDESWNYDYNEENWKQNGGSLSFTVNLPISAYVPFSREQMQIVQTQFAIQEMKIQSEQLKQNSELEIKKTVLELNRVVKQLAILERNLKLAERTLQLAERQYNLGGKTLSEVEDAQDSLNVAKNKLLEANYNYVTGLLDLEYSLNTPIEQILNTMNETKDGTME